MCHRMNNFAPAPHQLSHRRLSLFLPPRDRSLAGSPSAPHFAPLQPRACMHSTIRNFFVASIPT